MLDYPHGGLNFDLPTLEAISRLFHGEYIDFVHADLDAANRAIPVPAPPLLYEFLASGAI